MVKRVALALVVGGVVFGGVYGLAASLNLTSDSLGAASQSVAACQSGTLNAQYTSSYSSTVPGYTVGTVTVTGLTSSCYSMPYRITLGGSGNSSLGEATGTTPASGASFAATFSPAVNAASVTGVDLVISSH